MTTIHSKIYFAFILLLFGFFACGKKQTNEQVNTTSEDNINDELTNLLAQRIGEKEKELFSIDSMIRSFSDTLSKSLNDDREQPKEEVLSILAKIKNHVEETTKTIDALQTNIATNVQPIKGITNYKIEDMRKDLAQKNGLITNLEERVNKIQSKNINLKNELVKAEKELIAKDDIISKIEKERKQQQQELDQIIAKMKDYEARIAEAERKLADAEGRAEKIEKEAKQKIASTYYDAANEAMAAADNISGLQKLAGGKQTQKELYQKAYEYYIKAYESGFKPEAKNKICILETEHEKYITSKKICKK